MRPWMNGPEARFAFLGKAPGYPIVFLVTLATSTTALWADKLDGGAFSTLIIGCFVALAGGGGIAAFRDRPSNGAGK